ncbi:MAG: hypothetical protein LIO99_00445 [Clostridiales bacterium]|nr:hypothetical protein [Clostridiales bacterium]
MSGKNKRAEDCLEALLSMIGGVLLTAFIFNGTGIALRDIPFVLVLVIYAICTLVVMDVASSVAARRGRAKKRV